MLDYILNASKDKDCVIIYMTDHGISQRKIHIYEITEKHVKAYCYLRKAVRVFKRMPFFPPPSSKDPRILYKCAASQS